MFELVCIVKADSSENCEAFGGCFREDSRPDFDDDLPSHLAWIYPLIECIPNAETLIFSKDKKMVLAYWLDSGFDINRFSEAVSQNEFSCLGYFCRHYEDVGGEDDPTPNGVVKVREGSNFIDLRWPYSAEKIFSTSEIKKALQKATGFVG